MTSHLLELRRMIIQIAVIVIISTVLALPISNYLVHILMLPALNYTPNMLVLNLLDPIMIKLKIALYTGIIVSLPFTTYQVWKFFAPALYQYEQKILISVCISSMVLALCGLVFCYYLVLPMLLRLVTANLIIHSVLMPDIYSYCNLMISLLFIFALSFQLPLAIVLLIKFRIINRKHITAARKFVFVGCFIISAILAPPDVLSQIILALVLYLLYELGIAASYL